MDKPQSTKPQFYAACFGDLQEIAREMGYNLLLHGSLNRDFDLVAVPWIEKPSTHLELMNEISYYFNGERLDNINWFAPGRPKPGGRMCYVLNVYRWNTDFTKDSEYYIDISFTPFLNEEMMKLKYEIKIPTIEELFTSSIGECERVLGDLKTQFNDKYNAMSLMNVKDNRDDCIIYELHIKFENYGDFTYKIMDIKVMRDKFKMVITAFGNENTYRDIDEFVKGIEDVLNSLSCKKVMMTYSKKSI